MTSYNTAHRNVELIHGPASEHVCGCGAPAQHWAYQHTAEVELRSPQGLAYSTNPADYAAMCPSCHVRLDGSTVQGRAVLAELHRTDPVWKQGLLERFREAGFREACSRGGVAVADRRASDPEFDKWFREASGRGQEVVAARRAADPEFDQRLRENGRRAGKAVAARRAADPDFDKLFRENLAAQRAASVRKRRRCLECGKVSNPNGIGLHQRATGHVGWDAVPEDERAAGGAA